MLPVESFQEAKPPRVLLPFISEPLLLDSIKP
jgi:hypothetical protein